MAGGSIEKLKVTSGHSMVLVTDRYAHLRADLFGSTDLGTVQADLSSGISSQS